MVMQNNPIRGLISPLVQMELSLAQAASPLLQPLNLTPPVGLLTTIDRSFGNGGVPGVTGFDPIGQLLRSLGIAGVSAVGAPAAAAPAPSPGGFRVSPQPITGTASLAPAGVGSTRGGIS